MVAVSYSTKYKGCRGFNIWQKRKKQKLLYSCVYRYPNSICIFLWQRFKCSNLFISQSNLQLSKALSPVGLSEVLGGVSNAPPSDLRHLRHPPDDLGCCRTLRTRTHKATYNRLVLLAVLNHAPPIAALSGEKKVELRAGKQFSVNAKPRGDLSRRGRLVPPR